VLAINMNISPGMLEGPPVTMAMQLVELCCRRNKLEELVDRIITDYPQSITLNP